MELSLLLIRQIIVQFIMVGVGFTIVKLKVLKSSDATPISKVLLYVVFPCLIISGFQIYYTPEIASGLLFTFAVDIIINVLFVLLAHFIAKPLKFNAIEETSIAYSNAGNLIYPLVGAVLGTNWQIYCCAYFIVQTFLLFTHCESRISGVKKLSFKKIAMNINIIASIVGAILFVFKIKIPPIIETVFDGFAGMIAPASMLVIGMAIANCDFKEVFTTPRYYLICLLRLIVFPVLIILLIKVTGAAYWFDNAKSILLVVMMAASSCAASTVSQLSQCYNNKPAEAGMISMMTVLLLIVTMPLVISFYQLII